MSHHKPDPAKNVNLSIDGLPVTVPQGFTILEAARKAGVSIPTLCEHPALGRRAVCRLCVVECDGGGKLKAACANTVWEGARVVTNNARILNIRRMILELLLANHPQDCLNCVRSKNCELQSLAELFSIRSSPFRHEAADLRRPETEQETLVRDMAKCVKCGRCVEVCQEVQTVRAITTAHRGVNFAITAPYNQALAEGPCVYCGQCAEVCPVGAIYEYDQTDAVRAALNDPERHVVTRITPEVQAGLDGAFGRAGETVTAGKMVTAIKRLGFDTVFDTRFFTGVTVREEDRELLDRIKNKGRLPMISGCSPAVLRFIEVFYPDLRDHLFTGKSPQQTFGALVKTRCSPAAGIDPSKITAVSITPCIAQKFEARRPGIHSSAFREVDSVLTTRELIRMIKLAGIDCAGLPESPFDSVRGFSADAETASGSSGGGMETVPRTEAFGAEIPSPVDCKEPRRGISRTELDLAGTTIKAQSAQGLANARVILDSIRSGECDAAFVEISICPDGCNGGRSG
ncbi:MAG: (2Fe-2S)-binding protein [Treponema sp.]|jgi:NADH-quinone oxidoreductase subunit G/NADP-reducing hydrogenase subunit HndD|nr:(2Fe-2S)-binding protein [Treponema sp.]